MNIYATPKASLGLTPPMADGELWVLAGTASSKGIYLLNLPHGKIGTSRSVSNTASSIGEANTGVLGLGLAGTNSGAVEFLNGGTGAPIRTVAVSGPVQSVAAGDNGTTFYALNGNTKARAVAVIDSRTGKITANVPAPKDAVAAVPSPGQHNLYVLEPNGNVDEIAIPSGQLEALFSVGHSGYALTISPGGHTLYVLKGQAGTRNVAEVSIGTQRVVKVLPAPADGNGISLSPDGNLLYASAGTANFGNVQAYRLR